MTEEPRACLIRSQEFVEITNMDMMTFYLMFIDNKLPIVRRNRNVYIDLHDIKRKGFYQSMSRRICLINGEM